MSSSSIVTGVLPAVSRGDSLSVMTAPRPADCSPPGRPVSLTGRPGRDGLVTDLVEELVQGVADPLQPSRLLDREVVGDVPALRRDLVLGQVVLRLRAA